MLEKKIITDEQLKTALDIQTKQKEKKIGVILCELGYISKDKLNECLYEQIAQMRQDMETIHHETEILEKLSSQFQNFS